MKKENDYSVQVIYTDKTMDAGLYKTKQEPIIKNNVVEMVLEDDTRMIINLKQVKIIIWGKN